MGDTPCTRNAISFYPLHSITRPEKTSSFFASLSTPLKLHLCIFSCFLLKMKFLNIGGGLLLTFYCFHLKVIFSLQSQRTASISCPKVLYSTLYYIPNQLTNHKKENPNIQPWTTLDFWISQHGEISQSLFRSQRQSTGDRDLKRGWLLYSPDFGTRGWVLFCQATRARRGTVPGTAPACSQLAMSCFLPSPYTAKTTNNSLPLCIFQSSISNRALCFLS